ncbi:MAG: S41 family peptidase [Pirellulales bacterium]|nr:S41 family peptidase [Pirellulales bacterium]
MPRRNLWAILGVAAVSLVCYHAADRNPLGRYFSQVVDRIEQQYVEEVDRQKLWNAAVDGMIAELHDPYSHYDSPSKAAELEEELEQQFAGVGLMLAPTTDQLTVFSPIVGSPAYRAGILAGDVITKIDGVSTQGMTISEASRRMRGKANQPVHVTIERVGHSAPIEVTVTRGIVKLDSVLGDTRLADDRWNFFLDRDKNIAYLRIVNFGERTVDELRAALEELKAGGMKGLILDLRNNPGGLLPAAVGVCELFLPKGQTIVTVRGRDGAVPERKFVAGGGEKFLDLPLAVLVNHTSASASEIVAGCLQDHHRAVIIGERTWGKGTVQNIIQLSDDIGNLTLTTAKFLRPSEKPIHRQLDAKGADPWGVSPDAGYQVTLSDEGWKNWNQWRRERDIVRPHSDSEPAFKSEISQQDKPLRRAVDSIESKIAGGEEKPAI